MFIFNWKFLIAAAAVIGVTYVFYHFKDTDITKEQSKLEAYNNTVVRGTGGKTRGEIAAEKEAAAKEQFESAQADAQKGDANGFYELGCCYLNGIGTEKDLKQAAKNFRLSTEKSHPEGLFQLALLTYEGKGVPKNPQMADALLQRAIKAGSKDAKSYYAKQESAKK